MPTSPENLIPEYSRPERPTKEPEKAASKGKKFRELYPEVEAAAKKIENIEAEKSLGAGGTEDGESEKRRAELYSRLDEVVADIEANLALQEKFGLVGHSWIQKREEFSAALERGEKSIEIDIRTSKDGIPIISHSVGVKGKFGIFAKKLNMLTFEEIQNKYPHILPLEEAFQVFKKYSDRHELILDLKETGAVDAILELLQQHGIAKSVRIASLLPEVIKKIHDQCPEISGLIMNGGIVPYLTTPLLDATREVTPTALERFLIEPAGIRTRGWRTAKLGPYSVVFSAGLEDAKHHIVPSPRDKHEGVRRIPRICLL